MEELLEIGFEILGEGIVTWLFRILGLIALIGAVVAFVVYEMTLVAAGLAVLGIVLLIAPSIVAQLAGLVLELE